MFPLPEPDMPYPPLEAIPLRPELDEDIEFEPTLRSLPRPLMPLLLFLYRLAKYSHSSLSAAWTMSPSLMEANLVVRVRMVAMWNLFWWDCAKYRQLSVLMDRNRIISGYMRRYPDAWRWEGIGGKGNISMREERLSVAGFRV